MIEGGHFVRISYDAVTATLLNCVHRNVNRCSLVCRREATMVGQAAVRLAGDVARFLPYSATGWMAEGDVGARCIFCRRARGNGES